MQVRHPKPLDEAARRLSNEFGGNVSEETVDDVLDEYLARWDNVPVTAFIPVLAERYARQRLKELARKNRAG